MNSYKPLKDRIAELEQENAPCGYCGYMPNVYARQHASSCPTHEIEDLERRLDEFEKRIFQLEPENAALKAEHSLCVEAIDGHRQMIREYRGKLDIVTDELCEARNQAQFMQVERDGYKKALVKIEASANSDRADGWLYCVNVARKVLGGG